MYCTYISYLAQQTWYFYDPYSTKVARIRTRFSQQKGKVGNILAQGQVPTYLPT
jgi:hypothetical protein